MTIASATAFPFPSEALPGRRTGSSNPQADGQAARQLAWQRMMDQTQWAAWLDHPLLPVAQMALPPSAVQLAAGSVTAMRASAVPAAMAYRDATREDEHAAQTGAEMAATAGRASQAAANGPADPGPDAARPPARQAAGAQPAPPGPAAAGELATGAPASGLVGESAVETAPAAASGAGRTGQAVGFAGGGFSAAQLVLGKDGTGASLAGQAARDPRIVGFGRAIAGLAAQEGWPEAQAALSLDDQLPQEADAAGAEAPMAPARQLASNPPGEGDGAAATARLRLHSEWQEQGVRVWLGADQSLQLGEAGLRRLSQLLQTLCGAEGSQLVSLVCNGKLVYGVAPAGGEQGRRGRQAGAPAGASGVRADSRSQTRMHAIRNYAHFGDKA